MGKADNPDEGLQALAEALAVMATTEARFYRAETCFQQALDVARNQQAKSWELRTATSLARLWQSQDKSQDASDLLAP